jgi:hypothetical protein
MEVDISTMSTCSISVLARATAQTHSDTFQLFCVAHTQQISFLCPQCLYTEQKLWSTLQTEGPPPLPRDSHVAVRIGACYARQQL